MEWWQVVGAIGLTVAISLGKVSRPWIEYSETFKHPGQLIRISGLLLSCPMCLGVWIGFGAAMLSGMGWVSSILMGGVVSVSSWVVGGVGRYIEKRSASREAPRLLPHIPEGMSEEEYREHVRVWGETMKGEEERAS